jgi:DnaA-homolog protein
MLPQIPLAISLRESASFDEFIESGNQQTLADIKACIAASGEQYIYLWGLDAAGKSHLLQAGCKSAQTASHSVAYIPLSQAKDFSPGILSNLGALDLVCLDDIHLVCGDPAWELEIFRMFNQLRESGSRLIVSANCPPARLPVKLADLNSRLEWGLCCQLNPLDDEGRVQLLTASAHRRGLELPEETARYILSRATRETGSLLQLMDRLDRASLVAQRRLTIPFIKTVMAQDDD